MKKFCCFLLFSLVVLPIIGQKASNTSDSNGNASISKEMQFKRLMDSSDVYYTKGDYRKDLALNFELLKLAFEINKHNNPKSKYMDEFLTIFPNIEVFEKERFSSTIQPLITIASNNGFLFMNE